MRTGGGGGINTQEDDLQRRRLNGGDYETRGQVALLSLPLLLMKILGSSQLFVNQIQGVQLGDRASGKRGEVCVGTLGQKEEGTAQARSHVPNTFRLVKVRGDS